jgi:hypothetical protein
VKAFVIEIEKHGVWWAFDVAVLLFYASYAIKHFTNSFELNCNSQPFFRIRDCHKYWLHYFPNGFAGLSYNAFSCILSNS